MRRVKSITGRFRQTGKTTPPFISMLLLLIVATTAVAAFPAQTAQAVPQDNRNLYNGTLESAAPTSYNYWAKTYGMSGNEAANSFQNTTDGGYILSGNTYPSGAGLTDAWILKFNSSGAAEWQKTYGGTKTDVPESIQQASDGGYIVAGYTQSFGAGDADFWVLKLDSTGSVTWQKTFGGSLGDYPQSVETTPDGGCIVAGSTNSFDTVNVDAWLLKLNSSGSVEWQKTYGGDNGDSAQCIQKTSDGGYIMAGDTASFGSAVVDFWLVKLNSTGSITWQKTYGGNSWDIASSVEQTLDDGYIVAGYTESFGAADYDYWVLKVNSTGSVEWQKLYPGVGDYLDWSYCVRQTSDSGYIVTGFTASFGVGSGDVWVLKLNSTGSVEWQKTYGGRIADYASSILQTPDGGYIFAGDTYSFGAGGGDVWVVKLGAEGEIVWDVNSGASTHTTSVIPLDTDATVSTTSAAPMNSTATVQITQVIPQDTNATMKTLAPDITPPAPIANLATSSPTNDSVTLRWTAPGDDGASGNATGYVVKYSTSGPITDANWSSATTYTQSWIPAKNGTAETRVVTGLTPATKHWFAVAAYDEIPNNSSVSNSPSGTTKTTANGGGDGNGGDGNGAGTGQEILIIILVVGVAIATVAILVAAMLTNRKENVRVGTSPGIQGG
jgi:uncharacterized delta-60 repeat protein